MFARMTRPGVSSAWCGEAGNEMAGGRGKRLLFGFPPRRENRLKSSTADFPRNTRRISDENDKMSSAP